MIDNQDIAYVTDFGLSKAKVLTMMNAGGTAPTLAGRQVPTGMAKYKSFVEFSEIAGTPSYLAPELWRNESYTELVDVYSYGVLVWELLARDQPFKELDNDALVAAIREKQMRPVIPSWTPESLKVLVERCWSEGAPSQCCSAHRLFGSQHQPRSGLGAPLFYPTSHLFSAHNGKGAAQVAVAGKLLAGPRATGQVRGGVGG